MTKQPSPEKAAKELAKREKQLAKPKGRYYLAYLTFIISIIYITDEVALQTLTPLSKVWASMKSPRHFSFSPSDVLSVSFCPALFRTNSAEKSSCFHEHLCGYILPRLFHRCKARNESVDNRLPLRCLHRHILVKH